jgi:hypothetical protein
MMRMPLSTEKAGRRAWLPALLSVFLLMAMAAAPGAEETAAADTVATNAAPDTNAPATDETAAATNAPTETLETAHQEKTETAHSAESGAVVETEPAASAPAAGAVGGAPPPSSGDVGRAAERGSDARRSNRDRRGSSSERSGGRRAMDSNSAPLPSGTSAPDYAAFRIITDRNIFDPNRSPRRPSGPREKPKTVETFSLVGIMSYEKGSFAFFDGSSSSYQKVLKPNDTIAGYKLKGIGVNSVKLLSGTNEVEMSVGARMRREEEGEWSLSNATGTYTAATAAAADSTKTTTTDASASGAESDVIKRLMQKREQE